MGSSVTNAPFAWTKQVASDFGGTRNGMVVHWPAGIKAKGEVRSQFTHVIDIAPTVFEACQSSCTKNSEWNCTGSYRRNQFPLQFR